MRTQRSSLPSRCGPCRDSKESGRRMTCTLGISFPCLHNIRTEHPMLWDPSWPCDIGCHVPCEPAESCQHHCSLGVTIGIRLS